MYHHDLYANSRTFLQSPFTKSVGNGISDIDKQNPCNCFVVLIQLGSWACCV